jgi:23S rRNA (cytosine1962-C5)-methyltransferase
VDASADSYALLDAGAGRRLERFGDVILDRPAPGSASTTPGDPAAWPRAVARFERRPGAIAGRWQPEGAIPPGWAITVDGLTMELRLTPAGQVGVFPEHAPVARWAASQATALTSTLGRAPLVLNLFGYTGLATLALARAGAEVAHVDASRPAVAWARRNAQLSGLADRSIRWLVEDAARFVAREARRGRQYDGVLLDPPTYGHGPGGTPWRLEADLEPLLAAVRTLVGTGPWFVACTAHTAGVPEATLAGIVRRGLDVPAGSVRSLELVLDAARGARLAAGWGMLVREGRRSAAT